MSSTILYQPMVQQIELYLKPDSFDFRIHVRVTKERTYDWLLHSNTASVFFNSPKQIAIALLNGSESAYKLLILLRGCRD